MRSFDRRRWSATRSGVAGSALERLEQPVVIRHVGGHRVVRVVAQKHPRLGRERLVRAHQPRASGQVDELLVEADVGVDHRVADAVGLRGRRAQRVQRRPQLRQVGGGRRQDAVRRPDLDRLAGDVDVEPVGERHDPHERAAVGLVLDEPLLDELADGLPDGAATGAERARERHLAERLALRDATLDDRLAELAQDLLGHGRPLDARETPVVGQRRHWSPPVDCRQPYDSGSGRVKVRVWGVRAGRPGAGPTSPSPRRPRTPRRPRGPPPANRPKTSVDRQIRPLVGLSTTG